MTAFPSIIRLSQLLALVAACCVAADPEEIEPPLKYTLVVNGKPINITEDKPVRLGELKDAVVTLKVDPHRTFNYGGVTFRYPRHFAFEAVVNDKEEKGWKITGNDFKVTLLDVEGAPTAAEYVKDLTSRIGKDSWVGLNGELRTSFGRHVLEGVSAKWVIIAERPVYFEIYRLQPENGRTRVLILEDCYWHGENSKEGAAVIALLKESLEIKQK